MDKSKWSYLAGLFDGEGCVSIASRPHNTVDKRNGKEVTWKRTSLQISLANTNLQLMRWLVSNFGGVFYTLHKETDENWKPCYSWQPKGKANREEFLLGVLPYAIAKRTQLQLALEYLRLPLQAEAERDALVAKCRALNFRGKSVETNTSDTSDEVKIEPVLQGDLESAPAVMLTA
jgi:hypothetical protein